MDNQYRKFRKNFRPRAVSQENRLQSQGLFQLGKQKMVLGENDQALRYYDQAIEKDPNNLKAYCNKGNILKNKNQYKKAREAYWQSLILNQNDIRTNYNYANLQRYLGDSQRAIELYKNTINIIQQKKYGEKIANEVLQEHRLNSYLNMSVCFKIMNKLDQAIQLSRKIIKQFPNHEEGYFHYGSFILKKLQDKQFRQYTTDYQQKCNQAMKLIQKSLQINSNFLRGRLALIQCQYLNERSQQNYLKAIQRVNLIKQKQNKKQKIELIDQKLKLLKRLNQESDYHINKQRPKTTNRQSHTKLNSCNLIEQFMGPKENSPGSIIYYVDQSSQFQFQKSIEHQKYQNAIKIAERMVQSFQKNQKLVISYLIYGSQYIEQQKIHQAQKIYQNFFENEQFQFIKDRISIKGHQIMGYMVMKQKKYKLAIQHYEYILGKAKVDKMQQSKNNKLNFWIEQLLISYFYEKSFDQGINFCKTILLSFQKSAKIWLLKGCLQIFKSMRNEAYESLSKIKNLDNKLSNDQKIIQHLVYTLAIYKKQQQIQSLNIAAKDLNRVPQYLSQSVIYKQLTSLIFNRVQELFLQDIHKKNHKKNKQLFQIAKKCVAYSKFPKQTLLQALSYYHFYLSQYSQALCYLKKINKLKGHILIKKAVCQAKLQNQKDAKNYFQNSFKISPNDDIIKIQKGIFDWAFTQNRQGLSNQLLQLFSCGCLKKIQDRKLYCLSIIQKIQYESDTQQIITEKDIISLLKQQKCCKIVKQINQSLLKTTLIVVSLNYSGVLTSPYQYHQQQNSKQKKLNQIFSQQVQKVYPEFRTLKPKKFEWEMGILDTRWKSRYSAFNQLSAGVKQNGKMMNQTQFKNKWQQVHQNTRQSIKKSYFEIKYVQPKLVQEKMKIQIQRCREFDLFCYRTFMRIIYGVSKLDKIDIDSQQYIQRRQIDFSKPYLNQKKKIEQTLNSLEYIQHHVLFFQECHSSLVDQLQKTNKYHIIKRHGVISVIALNRQTKLFKDNLNLQQQNKNFLQKWAKKNNKTVQQIDKQLNFNKDSIYQVYKNFIFLNVHLTSNKQLNAPQMNDVKVLFHRLRNELPEYNLIFGGDFNQKFDEKFQFQQKDQILKANYFPNDPNIPTCKKKRTLMQPQRKKALLLDQSGKDYLVSQLPILDAKIMLMNGDQVGKQLPLLPNIDHPYDHYGVYTKFEYRLNQLK